MKRKSERDCKNTRQPDSNPLGFLAIAALAVAYIASPARAEADPAADDGVHTAIEEIVVVAKRRPDAEASASDGSSSASEDPLKDQITRHVREHGQLEEELEWRTSSSTLAIEFPQFHLGYDPRDDIRAAGNAASAHLPLDVVTPATVFRVDF
ncbi:MAG: hypothetical protein AAF417_17745 [Pseudomonadota bacterium]